MEKKLNFDDINWLGKVEDGSIKSLLVETLNKYFLNYNILRDIDMSSLINDFALKKSRKHNVYKTSAE